MCGITGIFAFNLVGKMNMIHLTNATMALQKRGPDYQDIYHDQFVGLGHRRLSIIDTSTIAHQPMWDEGKRFTIIFNGEIFNYRELRKELEAEGVSFFSQSDTEVLLKLYMLEKEKCLNRLNGFFAFCIYDKQEQTFFLARDRYGVKPLLYLHDEDKFIFASEMKSIMQYGIEKAIDYNSLYTYLQLNYIPAPDSIFKTVKKLMPGHYLTIDNRQLTISNFYNIPYTREDSERNPIGYEDAKAKFKTLLEESVQRRLVADVPLGCFLSGGIDSSVIAGLARKHKPDLHTFSIGFKDEKFFDETNYANLVSKHFDTEHTVFSLTNNNLYEHVNSILDYIDEPFADSSAINVYILSKETRKHATVALSGDGADELLGGYNKHAAHYRVINKTWKENLVATLQPFWIALPQSRNNLLGNKARQLARFAEGMKLSSKERYWRWAGFATKEETLKLLHPDLQINLWINDFYPRRASVLESIPDTETINDILLTDTKLVLPNDMLTKVDLMSMANSLEVRTPFLDYELVNFIFSLPYEFKVNGSMRKRILQDTFKDFLPLKLYNRPKKGFEVPLLKWLRHEMKSLIVDDLLSKKFVEEQGIFNYLEIAKLKAKLFSSNPGDVHAHIWGLIVFQWWWKKYN
ncbi:MAG: asparagine synthase (glutamine-hydrolyzing) [Cyclobacteriaceae bacterium]|nr:asparagine synthase (glutamine-hydrolyzing) [Cyclobacteriaceae bacterium]UYN87681.1 MAG: asparagine synthase (glutamine-hydrolyzing) [Cyclobacteriaceae bacterium]